MHSDRGSNYMSADFEMFLRGKGITQPPRALPTRRPSTASLSAALA